jgi:heme exporter protein C
MKKNWWKIAAVVLVLYSIIAGFLLKVPVLPILHETIRNLYFHVTMWFSMIILLFVSVWNSVRYLSGFNSKYDIVAKEAVHISIVFGLCGLATGMLWANYTWGEPWPNDPKLNGVAIAMLFYFAYLVLRNSIDEEQKRARIAAIYNIFAFVMFIVFTMILPRMTDSLHPGNGGNPGFGNYEDIDNNMRMVFYPAIIGWTLIGTWIMQLGIRYHKLNTIIHSNKN